jgi:hypothetical protein
MRTKLSLILAVQVVFAVTLYYFVIHVKEITVKVPTDTHWWIPWIPVIAAVIVTAGALITLYANKRLSEIQFDRQALESLFTDILNRFASENPIIRANAAIRLAEMVQKKWPGRPNKKTPGNYPFFPDATSQLAAALHMESNQAVRNEVVKALARVTEFAKQDDQALLHLLILELSDANRSAKASFVEAFAEWCSRFIELTAESLRLQFDPLESDWEKARVLKLTAENLRLVVPFASFCKFEENSLACLFSLARGECRAAAIKKAIRRKAPQTKEEPREAGLGAPPRSRRSRLVRNA